jgi:dienelactone hydrolase
MTRSTILALLVLAAPAIAFGQAKDVDLKTDDGTLLKATYSSPGKPGPAVLLLHMCNSQRKAWATLTPMLVAEGIHVLALDYRGYGESGGPKQAAWTPPERQKITTELWPKDFDKALAFLVAQPGVDKTRLGAAGGSCGVNNAIQLARRNKDVVALVLLAGGTDEAGERFLESAPWIPLFASGAHDDGTIVETLRWVIGFSSNPANQLKEYQAGGHGTDMFPVHKDLEPAIAAWFEQHLVTKPVKAGGAAKPGPSAKLAAKLRAPGGVAALRAEVRAAKKSGAKVLMPPEGAINGLGYGHLQAGRHKEAIELFTLNVEAHPESSNTYDSLGDAYFAAGDKAKAKEQAKKALEVLAKENMPEEAKKAIRESAEGKLKN